MPERELASAFVVEQARTAFDQERAALLVIGSASAPGAQEREWLGASPSPR